MERHQCVQQTREAAVTIAERVDRYQLGMGVGESLAGLFVRYAGRERYKLTDRPEARVLA